MSSNKKQAPSLWQMILSVLAAMFGVQSTQSHERDFKYGNAWIFIVMGLIAVILFVLSICVVVYLVLPSR